jgi:hypothetical protein
MNIRDFYTEIQRRFPGCQNVFIEPKRDSKLGPADENIFKIAVEYNEFNREVNFYNSKFVLVIY